MPIASLDGYPYLNLGVNGKPSFPALTPDTAEMALPRCRLSFSQCFTVDKTVGDGSKASEVFKQLAFREPRCGDCGMFPPNPTFTCAASG